MGFLAELLVGLVGDGLIEGGRHLFSQPNRQRLEWSDTWFMIVFVVWSLVDWRVLLFSVLMSRTLSLYVWAD